MLAGQWVLDVQVTKLKLCQSTAGKPDSHTLRLGSRSIRLGLRAKLLIVILFASLVTIVASSALLYNFQRKQLLENAYSTASTLNSTVQVSLGHAMETADWMMINDVAKSVSQEGIVETLWILNTQGVVGASSLEGEKGRQYTLENPLCRNCHTAETIAGDAEIVDHVIVPNAETGSPYLLHVSTIDNSRECHACHGTQQKVLGLLMSEMPLTALDRQLADNLQRSVLLALGAFSLLIGILVPVLNRQVIRPVEALSEGVAKISTGNLDFKVKSSQSDELGKLAESFENMRQQLKSSYTALERQGQDLEMLNKIGRSVVQLKNLQDIMDFTLDTVIADFNLSASLIYLWYETRKSCSLHAHRGVTPEQIERIARHRRAGQDIPYKVAESGKEVFVADMSLDHRFDDIWEERKGRSYANLPLLSRGTVVGVIALIAAPGRSFTEAEVEFLKAIGREVGIAIDNALLLAKTQQREQQAITLHEVSTKISASLALGEVLEAVAASAKELLGGDVGVVGLLDESTHEVVIRAASGFRAEALKGARIPIQEDTPARRLAEGQPFLVESYEPGQPLLHELGSFESDQVTSFVAAPLMRGERFLGVIEVITLQARHFLQEDAQLLLRLAHQVVVSIENAQLYRQLRYMATLEERDRLAREMHDHLAQALGYINIKTSMTSDLVVAGKTEKVQESLDELKKAAQNLYIDVREAIFNLRTAVVSNVNLLPSLQQYLNAYSMRFGTEVQLVIENDDTDEYSPESAAQLLHIVQEALTNVRKHSSATAVRIHYNQTGNQVRIIIEDNGQGFEIGQAESSDDRQHVGLNVMRERAESIGGRLLLDSMPGSGTRVLVIAPTIYEDDRL